MKRFELNFDEDKVNDVLNESGTSYDLKECCKLLNEQQMIIEKLKEKDLYNNIVFRNSKDMKRFQDILIISKLLIDYAEEENDKDIAYESLWQLTKRLSKLNDDEYWLDKNE